jgi:hypothetical protein
VPVSFKKLGDDGSTRMFRRPRTLIGLIYIIIGIVVAWNRGYITLGLLKVVLSAILAVFLWFLVLLGVNMHVTG